MELPYARAALAAAIGNRTEAEGRNNETRGVLNSAVVVQQNKAAALQIAAAAENAASVDDVLEYTQARRNAEAVAEAAARAVATAKLAHGRTAQELAGAQRAVESAADAVLDAEIEIDVAEAYGLIEKLSRVGERLRNQLPDELHTPVDKLKAPSARVSVVLEKLRAVSADDIHTPVNLLRGGRAGTDYRARRRAALIADGPDAESAAA